MPAMAGNTHIGQRELNEDCLLADADLGLAVVADGMGGREHGEVASAIVVDTLRQEIENGAALADSIRAAHQAVKRGAETGLGGEGMGSAVVAVTFSGNDYEICWIGDCRAYIWDGELVQITRDHSYVEKLLSRGAMSWEEAQTSKARNRITQAVGVSPDEELEVGSLRGTLAAGQELLLCSDGLNDVLTGQAIGAILAAGGSLEQRCGQLVDAAVQAGGRDNITVLLVAPDDGATVGPRPPAVSIARLDGSVEYFTAEGVPVFGGREETRATDLEDLEITRVGSAPGIPAMPSSAAPEHLRPSPQGKARTPPGLNPGLVRGLAVIGFLVGLLAVANWFFG